MADEMDSELVGSIEMGDMRLTGDAILSYSWRVDSLIRSETASNLGDSPLYTFVSRVDSAIRSSSASYEADYEAHNNNSTTTNVPSHSQAQTQLSLQQVEPHKSHSNKPETDADADASSGIMRSTTLVAKRGMEAPRGWTTTLPLRFFHALNKLIGGHQNLGTSPVHLGTIFTLAELKAATHNFSLDSKIGVDGFGVMYRGILVDGREVAIRWEETSSTCGLIAFQSELLILSRLHHKHLVGLVGCCKEKDLSLLVYEYMNNGSLYDHLHRKYSSELNSWKMRIKLSLDASRGIEYLHHYAVPSIIHRDIKSSSILLDGTWTARLSNFGSSLTLPEADSDYLSEPAIGTVGYIDPEYFRWCVVTTKSDVYGFGVLMIELLTGKRAIFKCGEHGGTGFCSVVDFAVPAIMAGELVKILDPRVGPPDVNEAEAVELVAYTAIHCVNLEGKDRPTMVDIVVNLERALAICDGKQDI